RVWGRRLHGGGGGAGPRPGVRGGGGFGGPPRRKLWASGLRGQRLAKPARGAIDRLLRLDLALDARAEGGAVVDSRGQVIGMAVSGPRRRVLAIPTATIDRAVDQLLAQGYVGRGYFGAPDVSMCVSRTNETPRSPRDASMES